MIYFLPFPAMAALGSKGLILEGGKTEITMVKGEKEYINVRDGWSGLPLFKGVTFYSGNTLVATVGQHSGILRANGLGKATVYAVNERGDAGRITVYVRAGKHTTFSPLLLLFLLPISLFVYKGIQKRGIC